MQRKGKNWFFENPLLKTVSEEQIQGLRSKFESRGRSRTNLSSVTKDFAKKLYCFVKRLSGHSYQHPVVRGPGIPFVDCSILREGH